MLLKLGLFGLLIPAAIAVVTTLAARGRPWAAALALGLGYAAGHVGLSGRPRWPVVDTTHDLFWFALAAAATGLVPASARLRGLRGTLALVLAGAFLWFATGPKRQYVWSSTEAAVWFVGLLCAAVGFWLAVDALVRRHARAWTPFGFASLAGALAVLLGLTGSALLGLLGCAFAATLGASALVASLRRNPTSFDGGVPVLALVLPGLWLNGYFYSDTPWWSAAFLALVPALALRRADSPTPVEPAATP